MKYDQILFCLSIVSLIIIELSIRSNAVSQTTAEDIDDIDKVKGFLLKNEDCTIPELDAFHSSIKPFLEERKPLKCNNKSSNLVESNQTSIYILGRAFIEYEISDPSLLMCCYTSFWRKYPAYKGSNFKIAYSRRCVQFSESASITHEFIKVECFYDTILIYIDYFSFAPLKPKQRSYGAKLNVLVIGIDSLSRLNFHRQMPRTVSGLKKLGGVEFLGFNKVADDLVSNLGPLLTGMHNYSFGECLPRRRVYYDKYSFIWKAFNKKNYMTAYVEDTVPSFTCFPKQPTDYDLHAFIVAALGDMQNNGSCLSARGMYSVQLDYLQKFIETMKTNYRNYFGFFWQSSLTHDVLSIPKDADAKYSNFIMKMNKTGLLNDTVLVVLSNHGMSEGGIMKTFQGKFENKLPFLNIYLPPWYRAKFPTAFGNLVRNKRRLTTSFDVYYTLLDLANPYQLTSEYLEGRNQTNRIFSYHSLFDVVSKKRTCKSVGIPSKMCAC